MNSYGFDILVSRIEQLGAPYSLPADWVLCTDLDILREIPTSAARRKWLQRAKKEAIHRNLQTRVDEISEAWDCNDELAVVVLSEAFPEDIAAFPDLSESERSKWITKATRAASGRGEQKEANNPTVYVISGVRGEFFKIGFTNSIQDRIRSLQTASPERLKLHLAVPGSQETERELHRRFAPYRAQGEWFKRCDQILQFIASNRERDGREQSLPFSKCAEAL